MISFQTAKVGHIMTTNLLAKAGYSSYPTLYLVLLILRLHESVFHTKLTTRSFYIIVHLSFAILRLSRGNACLISFAS